MSLTPTPRPQKQLLSESHRWWSNVGLRFWKQRDLWVIARRLSFSWSASPIFGLSIVLVGHLHPRIGGERRPRRDYWCHCQRAVTSGCSERWALFAEQVFNQNNVCQTRSGKKSCLSGRAWVRVNKWSKQTKAIMLRQALKKKTHTHTHTHAKRKVRRQCLSVSTKENVKSRVI